MYGSYILCGVFGCWEIYKAFHRHEECPKCKVSRAEIALFKSDDLELINKKKIDRELEELYNDSLGG